MVKWARSRHPYKLISAVCGHVSALLLLKQHLVNIDWFHDNAGPSEVREVRLPELRTRLGMQAVSEVSRSCSAVSVPDMS